MTRNVLRERGTSCDELMGSIKRAMNLWADRHPSIYFTELQTNSSKNVELYITVGDKVYFKENPNVLAYQTSLTRDYDGGADPEVMHVTGTLKGMKRETLVTRTRITFNDGICFYRITNSACFDDAPEIR